MEPITPMTRLCRLTNALWRKYKPMCDPVEGDLDNAEDSLYLIEEFLVQEGFISPADLMEII